MSNKLDELKVGDRVIHKGRFHDDVLTVKRLTRTRIFVGLKNGPEWPTSFRKRDGFSIGSGSWDRTWIRVPEPGEVKSLVRSLLEKLEKIAKENLRRALIKTLETNKDIKYSTLLGLRRRIEEDSE